MKEIIKEKNILIAEIEESDIGNWLREEFKESHPETLIKETFPKSIMKIIQSDHHKSKDGGFIISYDHWTKKWYIAHQGYIREAEGSGESFLEAAHNYSCKIRKENAKIVYGKIEDEVNKHLPKNISAEIDDSSISICDYSNGIDNLSVIASRKIKGKSVKEIIKIANKLLNDKF